LSLFSFTYIAVIQFVILHKCDTYLQCINSLALFKPQTLMIKEYLVLLLEQVPVVAQHPIVTSFDLIGYG
jgi:hypothetical protein